MLDNTYSDGRYRLVGRVPAYLFMGDNVPASATIKLTQATSTSDLEDAKFNKVRNQSVNLPRLAVGWTNCKPVSGNDVGHDALTGCLELALTEKEILASLPGSVDPHPPAATPTPNALPPVTSSESSKVADYTPVHLQLTADITVEGKTTPSKPVDVAFHINPAFTEQSKPPVFLGTRNVLRKEKFEYLVFIEPGGRRGSLDSADKIEYTLRGEKSVPPSGYARFESFAIPQADFYSLALAKPHGTLKMTVDSKSQTLTPIISGSAAPTHSVGPL